MIIYFILFFLIVFTFLLFWQFIGYPFTMILIANSKPNIDKKKNLNNFVSIIVAAYNEEKVIEQRIKNLMNLDFPNDKYEIIIVESGSKDNTYQQAKKIIIKNKKNPLEIRLFREKCRKGKVSALKLGKSKAKGDIIVITDANAYFKKDVLKRLVSHFKNPIVGAVSGCFLISHPKSKIANSESFYWLLEDILKEGESRIDSACTIGGTICAFRKDVLELDEKMITEDLDMAISARKKGYKIAYDSKAIAFEPSASTMKDQYLQKKRTSLGTIQCMKKHWKYLLIPRDTYTSLIFFSHKTLLMISPFLLMLCIFLYFLLYMLSYYQIILLHFICSTVIFSIFVISLIKKIGKKMTTSNVTGYSLKTNLIHIFIYVLLNEFLILIAWKDFLFKRNSVLWEKAESTREER